jgi:uncharacterized protein (DUF2384 family)
MNDTKELVLDLERDVAGLKREKLTNEGRQRVRNMLAKIEVLQNHLRPLLSSFSPESAGEKLVAEMQMAEGGAWPDVELRKKFNLTSAVLHRRRKEHRIIYWRDARNDFFYPRWQFTGTGALLPGIQEVLQIFQSQDEWRVMRYFLGPRKQLGSQRPLDLLRAGDVERILAHAKNHGAENTW